jgi:recombinational DNA repair protein (RecF pathway)
MPGERAHGVILRCRPLSETSLIVHWLTREQGRVATVAKGARRPKSAFRGQLDAFYRADFAFARSRRSDLHTLTEVVLTATHPRLRTEYSSLRAAAYATQLIEQTIEQETPVAAVFELLATWLDELNRAGASVPAILGLELGLLDELGLRPDLSQARLNPAGRQLAGRLLEAPTDTRITPPPEPAAVTALNHFLHGFLIYHLGRIPRTRGSVIAALAHEGIGRVADKAVRAPNDAEKH